METTTHTLDYADQVCWVTVPNEQDWPDHIDVQAHDLSDEEREQVSAVGYLLNGIIQRWPFGPTEWAMLDSLNPEARGLLDEELDMIGERLPERQKPARKINDVREALINASGKEIEVDGRRFKLTAGFRHVCYPTMDAVFCADAEIVNPQTDEDREFPIVPLMEQSVLGGELVGAFAALGGFSTEGGAA